MENIFQVVVRCCRSGQGFCTQKQRRESHAFSATSSPFWPELASGVGLKANEHRDLHWHVKGRGLVYGLLLRMLRGVSIVQTCHKSSHHVIMSICGMRHTIAYPYRKGVCRSGPSIIARCVCVCVCVRVTVPLFLGLSPPQPRVYRVHRVYHTPHPARVSAGGRRCASSGNSSSPPRSARPSADPFVLSRARRSRRVSKRPDGGAGVPTLGCSEGEELDCPG